MRNDASLLPMKVALDRLLTIAEAAERLGLKPSTIRKMILERRIDVVRPTIRAVRISESSLRRMMERGFRPAVEPHGP